MTRPRRVLTVVVERCRECPLCSHWDYCTHEKREGTGAVDALQPPPEWCPLPKEEP